MIAAVKANTVATHVANIGAMMMNWLGAMIIKHILESLI